MSQQDQPQNDSPATNPPVQDKKPSKESAADLARRLEERFKITEEDVTKASSKPVTREIGHTLKEELEDKTFIDLEQYTKQRSRYVESKYGLKPMNDLVAPKTEEEKKKELEDYVKKNNLMYGNITQHAANKIAQVSDKINNNLAQAKEFDDSYPDIYQWFENFPGYKPEINIGQKWANTITEQIKTETEMQRSLKKGGYIYHSWKKGKVGIDKYLILFGVFGAVLLPFYYYFRNKKYKEFIMAERGLKPGEELDLENGKWDLDDLSNHRRFFVDKEQKTKSAEKLKVQKEIKQLQQELYSSKI